MNRDDLRRWLTDQRSLAAGYGPVPGVDPDLILSSPGWGDAGMELDRGTALQLLHGHDPVMVFEKPDEVIRDVELARQADLRPGDQAVVAKLLWLVVAGRQLSSEVAAQVEPDQLVHELKLLWQPASMSHEQGLPLTAEDKLALDFHRSWQVFAWLEGLLLALRWRADRSPQTDSDAQGQWSQMRTFLARQIEQGLCERILAEDARVLAPEALEGNDGLHAFAHQKAAWCRVLLAAAAEVLKDEKGVACRLPGDLAWKEGGSLPILFRHACSLHSAYPSAGILETVRQLPKEGARVEEHGLAELLYLDEAIARLSSGPGATQRGSAAADPLQPMESSVRSRGPSAATLPSSMSLWTVLQLWLPDGESKPVDSNRGFQTSPTLPVVTAFVNVARERTPALLASRRWLQQSLLDHHRLPRDATFLPVPPGVSYPGLLAVYGSELVAFLFDVKDAGLQESTWLPPCLEEFQPLRLKWNRLTEPGEESTQLPWLSLRTNLGDWRLQQPTETPLIFRKDEEKVRVLTKIGNAFRALSASQRGASNLSAVASAAHLLKRRRADADGEAEWSLLGFALSRGQLTSQGFVRQRHSGSLLAEPVPAEGADLWRLGLALADFHFAVDRENSDPTSVLSAEALSLHKDQDPAVEAMVRSTLARLRGTRYSTGPPPRRAKGALPQKVERTLDRIVGFRHAFEAREQGRVLAFALACFLENRLDRDASDFDTNPGRSFNAAARLARSTRFLLGADAKLNQALPKLAALPQLIPVRRPARAWMMVAERLSLLPRVDEAELLALAVAGYRLLGLTELLRAHALERWATLEPAQRRADKWTLDLSEWGVNVTELLVAGEECEPPMTILERLSSQVSPKDLSRLEAVTPLGWLAVVAALSGLLPGNDFRPGLYEGSSVAEAIREGLEQLAVLLAEPWQPKADSTWRGFSHLIDPFGPAASADRGILAGILRALELFDQRTGAEVIFEESDRLYVGARDGNTWEVRSERFFAQEVPLWSIRELHLQNRKERWEEAPRRGSGDYRIQRRATLSSVRGKLIGAAWITRELAALAGLDQDQSGEAPIQRPSNSQVMVEKPTLPPRHLKGLVPEKSSEPAAGSAPLVVGGHATDAASRADLKELNELQRLQRGEWRRRSHSKRANTARIAFLQWSVDETYRHPVFEICHNLEGWRELARKRAPSTGVSSSVESMLAGNRELRKNLSGPQADLGDIPQSLLSCAEHRRRRMLTEVLAACTELDVDILLLPEYSMRPDTIAWLSDPRQISTKTSVWAGTYRLPPGTSPNLGVDRGGIDTRGVWSAILSAVLPDLGPPPHRVVLWRAKKYPSEALGEVFNPRNDRLEPLFPQQGMSQSVFDSKRYVQELICSEIFLATSPSNWRTLASSLSGLSNKLQPNPISWDDAFKRVIEDAIYFADHFSYQSATQYPRRSILLVPAMTPRTVDYAAFGQLNYLSGGLTTIFCNAVLGKKSIGNSCFIGHDSWDRTDQAPEEGMPSLSPYHGLTPGIFRQHALGRGWLGCREQALVVADVDPLHSVEGKPRPQALPPPLSLVAHLPVIESWTRRSYGCRSGDEPEPCSCSRSTHESFDARDFRAADLIEVLRRNADLGVTSTFQDHNPRELANLLRKLAKRAGHKDRDWLCRRAETYEKNHLNDPASWPPPVALDWLWVELGEPGDALDYPGIEVPPFRWAPGEERHTSLEESGEEAGGDLSTPNAED